MKGFITKTALALTVGAGAILLTGCSQDNGDVKASVKGSEATINKITRNQYDIKTSFPVEGHGLTAYVAQPKQEGQPVIFYSSDKTGDVFYGVLFDKDGNNLTEQYVSKHIQPMMAKKLFDSVNDASAFWVGQKNAPHQIYLVGEPNCSICHKLYSALKPYVDNGQLAIQWIMTAFLRPDSLGKAAAILQSDNPAKMLAKDESGKFDMKKEEGAGIVLSADKITEKTKAALKANMKFMVKNNIRGTPSVFYRDNNGMAKRIDGYPQESIDAFIKDVGRLSQVAMKKEPVSMNKEVSPKNG